MVHLPDKQELPFVFAMISGNICLVSTGDRSYCLLRDMSASTLSELNIAEPTHSSFMFPAEIAVLHQMYASCLSFLL